ncbi:hypothetical protein ACQ4M3_41915 [Leptolyngbya sp. AN03gr2]|uniref:hypothetical protein n=1 Tax=unclassified Leptolyngbya TaxID=2650499 RepID=UPI003D31A85B
MELTLDRTAMRIPRNQQMRISRFGWIGGEAIARYFQKESPREGLETALQEYVARMLKEDERFKRIWEELEKEGADNE